MRMVPTAGAESNRRLPLPLPVVRSSLLALSIGKGIAHDAPEGLKPVLDPDLLAFLVVTAVVGDGDLEDPQPPAGR